MRKLGLVLLAAWTASAASITISSYDIRDASVAGTGAWNHSYNGTITPGAGESAAYAGGSGTLNDGVFGTTEQDTQLFQVGALNPVITLFLPGSFFINSISFFGGPLNNAIPGCFTGLTVGIGGNSAAIATTAFGSASACNVPADDLATITGTSLQGIATTSIQLSGFTGPLFGDIYFSISEIQIDGVAAGGQVPEPETISLIGAGLLGVAIFKRRLSLR